MFLHALCQMPAHPKWCRLDYTYYPEGNFKGGILMDPVGCPEEQSETVIDYERIMERLNDVNTCAIS